MEWISIKERKPPHLSACFVANNRHSTYGMFQAIYYADIDVWVEYDPEKYCHACLDVTHYFVKPPIPNCKENFTT